MIQLEHLYRSGMLERYFIAFLPNNIFVIILTTMSFYEKVREHYLLVIKFCTNNVIYNFYSKRTIIEKNILVTKNVEIVL